MSATPAGAELAVSAGALPYSLDDCVRIALQDSARLEEGEAKVREFLARLAEVESIYYPKLTGLAFVAPAFTVEGNGYSANFTEKWRSIGDWGPFTNLELLLSQPLYTFGRAETGLRALQARADVERARLREARNAIALEIRKLYYGYLYASTLLPTLNQGAKLLHEAQETANDMYDRGTGEVTQVELSKLVYGGTELGRFILLAEDSASIALEALRHTMGLAANAPVQLNAHFLPALPEASHCVGDLSLAALLREAAAQRPEWAQLENGRKATLELEHAERLASLPILFLAGQFRYSWTGVRERDTNPWHVDSFNGLSGGIALGLKFDIDPALAAAKGDTANATGQQVDALHRFASTGIPLQVRRAYDDTQRARRTIEMTTQGVTATRQWMNSAATAYKSGTGDARDLLEGLAAYVQAKRTYLDSLQTFYISAAELAYAVGRTDVCS